MTNLKSPYSKYLEQNRNASLLRHLYNCSHPSPGHIKINQKTYVNFSTNDYLGLSQHPNLTQKACEYTKLYGVGSASSRLVTGNIEVFQNIEKKVADLKNTETSLIMVSGFQANATVLQALFDKNVLKTQPLVFSDRLNHSSMHFGCASAQVRQIRYRHLDTNHLEDQLKKHIKNDAPKFILTESVFSMDGDIAPMGKICSLAKQYQCIVICDDAHATGILGDNGSGLSGQADIIIGTFSKAMGSMGAYVACSKTIQDYLINRCTGLIYSTGLSPMVLGAIDAALDLLPELNDERKKTQGLASYFRTEVARLDLDTAGSMSQIVPVIVEDADKALKLSEYLKNNGYWVSAIRPPTVPQGTSRLRFSFCPHHKTEDIDHVLNLFQKSELV